MLFSTKKIAKLFQRKLHNVNDITYCGDQISIIGILQA